MEKLTRNRQTSAARSDSQRVALARSLARPIARNRGSTFKHDCRQNRSGEMFEHITWVRVEKGTRDFDEITKPIGHSRHYDFHRYNRLSCHVESPRRHRNILFFCLVVVINLREMSTVLVESFNKITVVLSEKYRS